MIRILQMGMTDNLGGIEIYLINYYRNIDKTKIQFDFTNIYHNKLCFQDEIEKMGGKVYKVSNYYRHPFKYIKEVKKVIKDNNYKIVHCNMNSAAMIYPLIAAKLAGAKVIIAHSHNNSSDKGLIKKILHNINRHFIPVLANQYYACSYEAGKWFYSKKIIQSKEFKIIENAIDTKKYTFNSNIRDKIRKELNIDKDTFVVGHVGRFVPQKNHTFLIDIFKEVYEKNKNSKLILIGIGDRQNEIRQKVKKMNLEENVLFLNQRNDINEIMMAMDVFALPSLYEGLGIVLVEAQASGLACVTSNKIPKIVELSDNFKQISLNESASVWADTILNIENNQRKMQHKVNLFNIEQCAKKLTNHYIDLNKIKICHFVNGLVNGGVEKFIINYFSNIDRKDYNLHIVTQGESDKKCLEEFIHLDFTIHTVTKKNKSILQNYKDIIKILKKEKFDMVHSHMTVTNFFSLFYSWLSGVKIRISHSHLSVSNPSVMEKALMILAKPFTTDKMACSKDAAEFLFHTTYNVKIINNAINLYNFKYNEEVREKQRKKLEIEDNKIVIGHVGRFVEQKNHKFVIDLFNKLYKDTKNYHLLLIGIGELEDEIKEKVKKLNIDKAVTFLETRNDVNELMQAMDIFILPSLFEGLGIVLIEAQTSGLYCFASSNIPKEVEVTNHIKLLDLDIDVWRKEISKIKDYKRKDYFNEISEKGFNIKKEAKKLDEIYKQIINRK